MNNVFWFFSNVFAFNRWFSDFSANVLLSTVNLKIFQQLFCFQLFSVYIIQSSWRVKNWERIEQWVRCDCLCLMLAEKSELSDFHKAHFDWSWSIFITRELGKNLWSCFRLVNISNRSSCCEFNTLYLYNKTATVHVECWLTIGICELCEKNRAFLRKIKNSAGFQWHFLFMLAQNS